MFALLLACAEPERTSCVDADAPPGDPVYRDCLIRVTSSTSTVYRTTDAQGRVVISTALQGDTWTWTREDEGACEVRTEERCVTVDGEPCGAKVTTRTCDVAGNITSVTVEKDGESTTTETAYTYDDDGRPVVEVYTVDGEPHGVWTCTYSDHDKPDACVYDPPGEPEHDDAWYHAWTRDEHGLPLRHTVSCMNPGYSAWEEWERDDAARTVEWRAYDTSMSTTSTYTYTYAGDVLDTLVTESAGPMSGGPFTTTYAYSPL